ncbi:hypothetical protein ACF064_36425 [Streptomyces sp. NPDC015492]|uniref:hypothetical protein n=1 Tax=Streptomyces sp. NPDC015492 TaxID=3364958 RepID=UPI0036FA246F
MAQVYNGNTTSRQVDLQAELWTSVSAAQYCINESDVNGLTVGAGQYSTIYSNWTLDPNSTFGGEFAVARVASTPGNFAAISSPIVNV